MIGILLEAILFSVPGAILLMFLLHRGEFWRRRSAIYGSGSMHWRIVRTTQDIPDVAGVPNVDWVELKDQQGLPVETALRLINTYPSLQAMLDRIAEIEKGLATSQLRRQESFAAMLALRQIIANDKQRYKSPAAKNIASYVEIVIRKARENGEPEPSESQILDWMRFGPNSES